MREVIKSKCLYKINFIFCTEILEDFFHISDQMRNAGIRPKFDPFIFHKTPQDLNEIQFGRIRRQVENASPFFLPFRYLFLERLTRVDRCIIHHDNRWPLYGFAKLVETADDYGALNGPFKRVGVSLMPFIHKSEHIDPLAWRTGDRHRVPLFLSGIRDIRHETKARCIKIAQINDTFSIFCAERLERFPPRLIRLRVRALLHGGADATPAESERF